jgi:hypothetical protein
MSLRGSTTKQSHPSLVLRYEEMLRRPMALSLPLLAMTNLLIVIKLFKLHRFHRRNTAYQHGRDN